MLQFIYSLPVLRQFMAFQNKCKNNNKMVFDLETLYMAMSLIFSRPKGLFFLILELQRYTQQYKTHMHARALTHRNKKKKGKEKCQEN